MTKSTHVYLYADVIVLLFSQLHKDGKEGQDGVCAEEGALRPNYCCWEKTQKDCQQPVERLSEHTLPVPLWGSQKNTPTLV